MNVKYDFNQIILANYTQKELRRLHALAEALVVAYRSVPSWEGVQGRSM